MGRKISNLSNKAVKKLRITLLVLFLILITVQAYLHQVLGGDKAASIHALCPYGALESLYSIIFSGSIIQKIYSGTFILLGITLILAIIFRRSFCGLICPLGTIQELFGKLGKKIFKKNFKMPDKIDKPLRYLKYLVLLVTLYFAWKTAGLWMSPYDPWAAYGHIGEGFTSLFTEYLVGTIILIITLIGSLLYDRFFCKYLCPMGAFYGIISKLSPYKITRNCEKCTNCGLCNKSCPMNIKITEKQTITSSECINCQNCILSCPHKNTLENKVLKKKVNPIWVIILTLTIFFGGIFISSLTPIFEVTPPPVVEGTSLTVEEIKGYMTIETAASALGMSPDELCTKLKVPTTIPKETKLKDISTYVDGFEFDKAKDNLE